MSEDYEPEIYGISLIPFGGIVGFIFLLLVVISQQAGTTPNSEPTFQYSTDCEIVLIHGVAIAASQPWYPDTLLVPTGSTAEETQKSLEKTKEMFRAGTLPI